MTRPGIDLTGKVALVTGGARGQGAVEVRRLAEAGAAVLFTDILADEGAALADQLTGEGLAVRFAAQDTARAADWQAVTALLEDWQGRLDILVNNAGIINRSPIASITLAEWDRVIGINQTGVLLGMQAALPLLRKAGGGSIINIASNSALSAHQSAAYSASKWAVRGLTRVAAAEFARDGIRCNAICPGLVLTDLNRGAAHLQPTIDATPLGRAVEAGEVANLVLFLASDLAGSITGQDIVIDGGFVDLSAYWSLTR